MPVPPGQPMSRCSWWVYQRIRNQYDQTRPLCSPQISCQLFRNSQNLKLETHELILKCFHWFLKRGIAVKIMEGYGNIDICINKVAVCLFVCPEHFPLQLS